MEVGCFPAFPDFDLPLSLSLSLENVSYCLAEFIKNKSVSEISNIPRHSKTSENDVEHTPERYFFDQKFKFFDQKFMFSLFPDLDLPPLRLGPDPGFWGKSFTNRIVLGAPEE